MYWTASAHFTTFGEAVMPSTELAVSRPKVKPGSFPAAGFRPKRVLQLQGVTSDQKHPKTFYIEWFANASQMVQVKQVWRITPKRTKSSASQTFILPNTNALFPQARPRKGIHVASIFVSAG